MIRRYLARFKSDESFRIRSLLIFAFLLRLISILPYGNQITFPYRDQNTYYSLARALVDDGYLGVPTVPRGPYVEDRTRNPHPEGFYPAFHDSIVAMWDAERRLYGMVEWGKPNSFFEPLYPLMAAGMYLLFGDRFFFWRLVHVLMGVLLVYFVYDIGKRAFRDERVGTIAALYTCIYPHFIFYSWILMAEALLLVLLALGLFAYFRMLDRPRWYWAIIMGVSFGLFFLTRSFIIAFFPVMILWMLIFLRNTAKWKLSLLAVVAFILTISPWIYRNYQLHHQFILLSTRGGYNLWMRNNPYFIADELEAMGVKFKPEKLDKLNYREYILGYPAFSPEQGELERNAVLTREGIKFIKANPGFFLEMCWLRFKWTVGYKGIGLKGPLMNGIALLSYGPVLLGFILSFFLGWKKIRALLPFWSVVSYFLLFYSLTHEGLRYRLPADPYIILAAVFSYLSLFERLVAGKISTKEPSDAR